jgi:hypothetical protein
MSKLKLELDELAVESFDTLPADDARRGTVEAFASVGDSTCRQAICYYDTYAPTCAGATCATCDNSCAGTCDYSCNDPSCATCLTYCGQMSCVEICP